jgi:hypothetical protein
VIWTRQLQLVSAAGDGRVASRVEPHVSQCIAHCVTHSHRICVVSAKRRRDVAKNPVVTGLANDDRAGGRRNGSQFSESFPRASISKQDANRIGPHRCATRLPAAAVVTRRARRVTPRVTTARPVRRARDIAVDRLAVTLCVTSQPRKPSASLRNLHRDRSLARCETPRRSLGIGSWFDMAAVRVHEGVREDSAAQAELRDSSMSKRAIGSMSTARDSNRRATSQPVRASRASSTERIAGDRTAVPARPRQRRNRTTPWSDRRTPAVTARGRPEAPSADTAMIGRRPVDRRDQVSCGLTMY